MIIIYKNLQIRNATLEDAKLLAKWWNDGKVMEHAGFPNGLNTTPEKIIHEISTDSDDSYRRLIIEVEDSPIGEMNYKNKGNNVAEIGIKICELHKQEKGYGRLFLQMLISKLFENSYEKIILDTNLTNARAQYVYEKLGFQKVQINYNSWTNQVGELQSSIDYELLKSKFQQLYINS